jgi:hypothetical protein
VVGKFSAHLIGHHFVGVQDVAYHLYLFGAAGLGFDDRAGGVIVMVVGAFGVVVIKTLIF